MRKTVRGIVAMLVLMLVGVGSGKSGPVWSAGQPEPVALATLMDRSAPDPANSVDPSAPDPANSVDPSAPDPADSVDWSAPDPANSVDPATPVDPAAPAPPAPNPAGMAATERSAVSVVDGFWMRHFTEYFGRSYRSPRVSGPYLGTNGPSCGGQRAIAFNAFYCRPRDFLAWDDNLMAAGYRQIGDSWIYLVIAHEWGHAIQARIGRALTAVSVELQADCLAGATLQGAANDGLVRVDQGDSDELGRTLTAAADDYPWTNQRDHGDAQQRITAFNTGARNGVKSCF